VAFETKALDDTGRTFEGYGSVFGVLDSYADIVAKGAFKRTLKESKAKGGCRRCSGSTIRRSRSASTRTCARTTPAST
jgi:hypothetical protein